MTEQEKIILIETEQRSKSNSHRIDSMELEARLKLKPRHGVTPS